jgi:hypothetical protein
LIFYFIFFLKLPKISPLNKHIQTMKTNLLCLGFMLVALPFISSAQCPDGSNGSPCNTLNHAVFKAPSKKRPVTLNMLGTSPQFGEIPEHTASSAYNHLKKIHSSNTKNSRREIDNLLRALGYSGFNDPAFNETKITPEILTAGRRGWMGAYSKGHKYAWSILGQDFPGYLIQANVGECGVYIMKKCGNAFYIPMCTGDFNPYNPKPPVPEEPPAPPMANTCKMQTINISGKGQIQSGDVLSTVKEMQIVATDGKSKVCLGMYPISMKTIYEYNAKGEITPISKTVEVCNQGDASPVNMNMVLPMALGFKVVKQDMSMGEGNSMVLNVAPDQFKTLKKVYKECAVDASAGASENFTKKVTGDQVASSGSAMVSGLAGNQDVKCADQKFNFVGKTAVQDGLVKNTTQSVTVMGVYKKTGKLAPGETAEKYLCLGTFPLAVKSVYEVAANGDAMGSANLKVCTTDGAAKPDANIDLPIKMTYDFTKQDVTIGNSNKVMFLLNESQYKSLSKSFNRCCTGGDGKCSN